LHQVLLDVRRTMTDTYGLQEVAIKSVGSQGARLSIPVRITGVRGESERVRLFGKIMGSSDVMSSHSMQLAKNVWLRMNGGLPLFGLYGNLEEMVKDQHDRMLAIHRSGVPTAIPYGYHRLGGGMWLLVVEFLDARPVSEVRGISPDHADEAFRHLRAMHRKRIHHGDIKPDNILVDDQVYILDIGYFDRDAPVRAKVAYDVASMACSFLGHLTPGDIVDVALRHHSRRKLRAAAPFVALVQRRPDFDIDDATRDELVRLMRGARGSRYSRRPRKRRSFPLTRSTRA